MPEHPRTVPSDSFSPSFPHVMGSVDARYASVVEVLRREAGAVLVVPDQDERVGAVRLGEGGGVK